MRKSLWQSESTLQEAFGWFEPASALQTSLGASLAASLTAGGPMLGEPHAPSNNDMQTSARTMSRLCHVGAVGGI
jgi:hypothetical protein